MKPKHTPGPWEIDRQDSRYIIREALGMDLSSDSALDELDANAALISAAPDMFEALELIRTIASESYRSKQEMQDAIQSYAERALNKARGDK